MADKGKLLQPIIVKKKIKKSAHVHHGGAWKIAYADFVTAMMAFFLLMWLLGSTTQGDLKGISDYFNTPLKVALTGGSGSGDSTSIIKGGGKDITRDSGLVKRRDSPNLRAVHDIEAIKDELARQELTRLAHLKKRIEDLIGASAALKPFERQIRLDIISDGLQIQVIDEQNRPMFDSGRAVLKVYSRDILREIGRTLNDVENRISLAGHTDAAPFVGGVRGYSNWELSADRANAARRELAAGGADERKILRVVGLAASVPLIEGDPQDARNRRISIIVMNKKAEDAILRPDLPLPAQPGQAGATADHAPAAAAPPGVVPAAAAAVTHTAVPAVTPAPR